VIDGASFTMRKDCIKTIFKSKCNDCNHVWHDEHKVHLIQYKAKQRKIYFEENDIEEFEKLVEKPCHYCGFNDKKSGLDRLDSKKGYILENVVPCCLICNIMKGNALYDVFLERIQKIVSFNDEKIQRILKEDYYAWDIKTKFSMGSMEKNDKTNTLSIEEKNNIKKNPCYLCGDSKSIGIDRYDSSVPYILKNCMPCCKVCNMMKKDFSYECFLYKCHTIMKTLRI